MVEEEERWEAKWKMLRLSERKKEDDQVKKNTKYRPKWRSDPRGEKII